MVETVEEERRARAESDHCLEAMVSAWARALGAAEGLLWGEKGGLPRVDGEDSLVGSWK